MSNEARRAGLEHLQALRPFPAAALRAELLARRQRLERAPARWFETHEFACLLETLMLAPERPTEQLLLEELRWSVRVLSRARSTGTAT